MSSRASFLPDIWVLLTHAPGDNDQCLALADALDRPSAVKRIDWAAASAAEDRARIRDLLADTQEAEQDRRAIGLHGPWPRIVICCGRRSDRVGFWIKRQSGGFTKVVSIGRAHKPIAAYDLLAAPPQFLLPERSNVVNLALPLTRSRRPHHQPRPFKGAKAHGHIVPVPKPWFTILLGGEAREFSTSKRALVRVAQQAQMAADRHGGSVVVSTSRRTPPDFLAAVERALDRPHIFRWGESAGAENPYELLLDQSAALFVTADSASMILDCCATGTPTFVIEYPERLDLRRRWRRGLFRHIRGAVERFRDWGLDRAGERLEQAQDWLHARRILRYPRDLRRIHASVYAMGLARPAATFDPTILPLKRIAANDLVEVSGVRQLAARCRALHSWTHRIAAE